LRENRKKIKTLLLLKITIVIAVLSVVAGTQYNSFKTLFSRAENSCYSAGHSYIQIQTPDGAIPYPNADGRLKIGYNHQKNGQTIISGTAKVDANGETYGNWPLITDNFDISGARAYLTLMGYDTDKYQIMKRFCHDFSTDGITGGCDRWNASSDPHVVENNLLCNNYVDYGWILQEKVASTPPPAPPTSGLYCSDACVYPQREFDRSSPGREIIKCYTGRCKVPGCGGPDGKKVSTDCTYAGDACGIQAVEVSCESAPTSPANPTPTPAPQKGQIQFSIKDLSVNNQDVKYMGAALYKLNGPDDKVGQYMYDVVKWAETPPIPATGTFPDLDKSARYRIEPRAKSANGPGNDVPATVVKNVATGCENGYVFGDSSCIVTPDSKVYFEVRDAQNNPPPTLQKPKIRLIPDKDAVKEADEVTIRIDISEGSQITGARVLLDFDASKMEVIDANPGKEGIQIYNSTVFLQGGDVTVNTANNYTGKVDYEKVSSSSTASEGILATVKFKIKGSGPYPINFNYTNILTRSGAVSGQTENLMLKYVPPQYSTSIPQQSLDINNDGQIRIDDYFRAVAEYRQTGTINGQKISSVAQFLSLMLANMGKLIQ
jgi:hypothetical protein